MAAGSHERQKPVAEDGMKPDTRVLVIAPQPFFTPRGTPFSVYYRTLVMRESGAKIDLLTYGEGQDVAIPGVRIVRIPRIPGTTPTPVGPSLKKMVLDVFMILWTIGLLLKNRYQVVHAHEEAVFWCRALKPLFRFRLIYDMHSSLPQQLTNFEFSKSRFLIGAFRGLEDWSLRAADAVITICPDLRDYALSRGVDTDRHLLIENSIFDDVKLAERATAAGGAAQPAKRIEVPAGAKLVLYAGTFEPYQGLDILLKAFALVLERHPSAYLLVVGGTPEQVAAMRALVDSLGIAARCSLPGRVTKTEALRLTAAADVLVSPRRHGTNTPLKIYEQLASGKPLVATKIWSHTQVLTDDVCFLVEPEPSSMAEGLLAALGDPARSAAVAANARALYEREYARPVYERKIRRLLELVT
jgi:glycosyltransferase involved in cell wall biosynthesis